MNRCRTSSRRRQRRSKTCFRRCDAWSRSIVARLPKRRARRNAGTQSAGLPAAQSRFLILAGFVIVLVLLQRLVLAPLLSLSDGINRLAAGDGQARIALSGPAEVQRTAEAFNDLADRLARHEEERRLFLAGVAHDLRIR